MSMAPETKPGQADRPIAVEFQATLSARVHAEPTGGYWAEVPALPGCYTQGETIEEIRTNLREAAELWLETKEDLLARGEGVGGA